MKQFDRADAERLVQTYSDLILAAGLHLFEVNPRC